MVLIVISSVLQKLRLHFTFINSVLFQRAEFLITIPQASPFLHYVFGLHLKKLYCDEIAYFFMVKSTLARERGCPYRLFVIPAKASNKWCLERKIRRTVSLTLERFLQKRSIHEALYGTSEIRQRREVAVSASSAQMKQGSGRTPPRERTGRK